MAARGEPEERAQRADREQHVARDVACRRGSRMPLARRQPRQAPRGERRERQVRDEEPPPAHVGHHDAADDRAADARGA